MKIFLTGSTGFIGSQLAENLADEGHEIHALVRSKQKALEGLNHPNIIYFEGNLDESDVYLKAMEDCEQAYLLAAYAQVWNKDASVFYKINVEDNFNLVKAGFSSGIKKIVVTSTAGTLGPSSGEEKITEDSKLWTELTTDYEKSKLEAEQLYKTYVTETGHDLVIVNPTRVYGPGKLSASNSVTRMIKEYAEGKWHVYPGNGKAFGNYVFVKDVISGHKLAMSKGLAGENYILGGEEASYRELFEKVKSLSGKSTWLIGVPIWVMMLIARVQMMLIPLTGKGPLLTPGFVKKYNYSWRNSSEKARKELGYTFTSLNDGIKEVLTWAENT